MEDKEIISTECEYFKINRGFYCYKGHDCTDKECSDCYYRQLKRLQQDYVRLGKTFEHLKTSYQENQEYFLELNAENERLKEENEKFIKVTNDSIIEQEKQIARINCLKQENEQLEKENKVNLSRSLDLNREIQNLSAENAELKAENERLKEEKTELEEKFLTLNGKSYSYYTTLQEIKAIAESEG